MKTLPKNYVDIVVHPRRFEVRPERAEVIGGYEELKLGINWLDNQETWLAVTVCNFRDSEGNPVPVDPPSVTFNPSQGSVVVPVSTPRVAENLECKYDIEYERADPPETFVVDPTVLIRPYQVNP